MKKSTCYAMQVSKKNEVYLKSIPIEWQVQDAFNNIGFKPTTK